MNAATIADADLQLLDLAPPETARERRYRLASPEAAQRIAANNLAHERGRRERAEASEIDIRQAMVFKDALIQEVNHRVKNTLQIAASVLLLQARTTASAEVRGALQEGYRRLHLLAKVHELLYSSADSAQEILMSKLLQAMGDALQQSFAEISAQVSLQITSDPILLSADDAIPMALLANEVLTNAYKHAFPGGCAGEITVELSCAPDHAVVLKIADNGIGIRPGTGKGGLGLELTRNFAQQLHGTLCFDKPACTDGTAVTLTIHREPAQIRV